MNGELLPNKTLQRTFDPPLAGFAVTNPALASSAAERGR